MNKIAFVVPTKDRPEDLRKMLASLQAQTRLPDQLIVVDGSNPDVRHVVDEFATLRIEYVRVFPPSLAKQRNAGMKQVRQDITLAGYLDDDIVLEPDAVEKMLQFWEGSGADLGGTVFNITNSPMPRAVWLKRWFWIDSPMPGRVLPSGCASVLGCQPSDIETDWLCGGATVWRKEVVQNYPYDEWFQGTGFMEDVDFSFNVREKYRLMLVSSAKLAHYSPPVRPDRQYLLGKWQIVNRMYLVRKYRSRGLSVLRGWVASIGFILWHLGQALLKWDRQSWDRARGNVAGALSEIAGKREQITGYLK
jgi:glycosyltransferase involved in cell wall biosynthesis